VQKYQVNLSATNLSNHLICNYLTQLQLQCKKDNFKKPTGKNAFLDRIIERGLAHEEAYIRNLESIHCNSIIKFELEDRADMADTPELSDHTSTQLRIQHGKKMQHTLQKGSRHKPLVWHFN